MVGRIFASTYVAAPWLFIEFIPLKFHYISDVGQGKLQRLGYLFPLLSSRIASFSQMQLLFLISKLNMAVQV